MRKSPNDHSIDQMSGQPPLRQVIKRGRSLWRARPVHDRRIAAGFLWVGIFILIGKLAGAAKEMAVAWRYGAGAIIDAYVFDLSIITWPITVWFSVVTVTLVPLIAELRNSQPDLILRFRQELAGLALLLGVALGLALYWALPWALHAGWTGLKGEALKQAIISAETLAAIAPLGVAIGFQSAWMLANGNHRNTLLEAVPALVILAALLLPADWIVSPLICGTVVGYLAQFMILGSLSGKNRQMPFLRLGFTSPAWGAFSKGIFIMAAGQAVSSFANIVDQFFAAGLPPGSLATLSYANRILALVLGLGATAIGRATLPVFSEMQKSGEGDMFGAAIRWSALMFIFGLLGFAVACWMARPLVSFLFERGSFTPQDSEIVANVLSYALSQLPLYFATMVMVSALSASGHYGIIAVGAIVNLIIKTLLCIILVGNFELRGVVLASTGMYFGSLIFLFASAWWVVRREDSFSGQPRSRK